MTKSRKKLSLSVIIISFNTKKILTGCLKSLIPVNSVINMEVIVVDNASEDNSNEAVKGFMDRLNIKFIENKKNQGFGAANNQAMKIAEGEFFLLLNSDTIVNSESISSALDYMRDNENVGVLGSKLVGPNGEVQSNGGYFPSYLNVFFWMTLLDDIKLFYKMIKPYHINPKFSDHETKDQDWVTGAFFMLRKKVYQEVGGFDEDYFMYVEEMDFCYRIKQSNWKVIYYPQSEIIHLGGASGSSEDAIINEFKGLKLFYNKHKGTVLLLKLLFILGSMIRIFIFAITGDIELTKIYVKAIKNI